MGEKGWIKISYDEHKPMRPFFCPFYGGTGIFYVAGVYGNFMPYVQKIQIESQNGIILTARGVNSRPCLKECHLFRREAYPALYDGLQ